MLEVINQKYMFFLFEIYKRPRNVSELSKAGDLTISVTSSLISRLAREGVVIKQKSSESNKEIIIYLTEYGREQIKLLKQLNLNYRKHKEGKFIAKNKKELAEVKNDI